MSDQPTTPEAAPGAAPASHQRAGAQDDSRRPRTGPIVWGSLILIFCAYSLQQTLAPGSVDSAMWIVASVIGLGLLLLIVGVAVIIRSRGDSR